MTDSKAPGGRDPDEAPRITLVGNDKVQVEFRIDQLVNQLIRQQSGRPLESCSGCASCSN